MAEPYFGEIQLFGFNFAPLGWAFCNGATLSIQQNTALYSLLGIQYGGNGTTNFQLPNLMARAPCSQGQGPGLTSRSIGESFGQNSVTLLESEIPAHIHALNLFQTGDAAKSTGTPVSGGALSTPGKVSPFSAENASNVKFAANSVMPAGGSQPHENRQPYLAVNFCIALQGIYPSFE